MRIGQRLQLVLIVFDRLMVGILPNFDRHQIVGDFPLVHDDIWIDGFAEMIVGRDDGAMGKPQRALAQPVVVAIDLPARKLLFDVHRQPVGQRALAEVLFQHIGLM